MNHRSGNQVSRRSLALLAASIGIAASFGASAESTALRVMIHGDHYAFDGSRFDRLASLETAVHSAPRWIELDACGPNAARTLKAASYRFSELPQRLRVLDASGPACTATIRTSHDIGVASETIDDARVEAYWRQRMP
jgi:hypothetical protein